MKNLELIHLTNMEANSLVPKLRFRQFTEKQSVCRVNKIAAINPKNSELPENFIYIDLESVKKGVLIKNNVLTKSSAPSRAQRLLETGVILYQSVRPYQKNNYLFELKGSYVASTGYLQIKTKMNYAFLYHYFHNNKFVNNVIKMCTGANYPTISSKDFGNILVSLPPLAEQNKIASFLSSVDKKINLLNKKKALLESYKKGVMQKIFSREIRFKDEDGKDFPDWEENKLRKFSDKISDGIHSTPKYNNEGQFFFVNGNNLIGGKIIVSEKTKKVDENEFEKHKRLLNNRTILISINGTIGNIALYNNEPIILGKSACYINLNESINKDFLFQYIHSDIISRYFNSQLTGSTIMNLSLSAIKNTPLNLPSLNEQKKIASFLTSVDKKIELIDFQLERNKEFKKGLLQQMFV